MAFANQISKKDKSAKDLAARVTPLIAVAEKGEMRAIPLRGQSRLSTPVLKQPRMKPMTPINFLGIF